MGLENINLIIEKSKKLRLLYVEDNDASRSSILESLGIFFEDITVVNNGSEGFEAFLSSKYDLIITDINMPVLSGTEMIQKIRQTDSEITILILSADVSTDAFTKTIRAGIEGYLLKPIDLKQFIALIKKSVDNIASKKEIKDYKINLEKKVQEQTLKIKKNLFIDSTTGLYNFLRLNEDIKSGLYKTLILCDISQFSIITLQYGRELASKLLVEVANILKDNITIDMQVYKLDSDRFAIVSKNNNQVDIKDFCQQLLAFCDMRSMSVDGVDINIVLSIGIAFIDNERDSTIDAEYALENAKKTGNRYYSFYDINNDEILKEQNTIMLLNTIKELIYEDGIVPHYEAIFDMSANDIISYEVSARGLIDGNIVQPSFFINSAEKLGLLSSVTKIVIQKSFQFFTNNDYNFSIKITYRDLREGYLPDFLKQKLKLYNINPNRVTLEILESISILTDAKLFEDYIESIKELGVQIIVYDLGVENSKITKLVDLNLDLIKIDGHLISNMIENEKAMLIVKHISSLAKTLEIKVVAENIDTKESFDIAKKIGIDYVQGSYIGESIANKVEI